MRSYLGIPAHFIHEWAMETVVLACKRFRGRHPAMNIVQEYEETVQCFDLGAKIGTIVTDNASKMVAAFNLPGFPMAKTPASPDSESEGEEEDLTAEPETDPDMYEVLPAERTPCFAHTLQLVVKDGLKEAGQVNRVIGKTAKLVSFIHKSTCLATDILEGERHVETDCQTRWNSQVKMIRSMLRLPEDKLNKIEGASSLGAYDRNVLRDFLRRLTVPSGRTRFLLA